MQTKSKTQIISAILSVLVSVFLVAGVVYAVTTISATTITLENGETISNGTDGVITVKTNNTADWSAAKLRLYSRGDYHYGEIKNINYPEVETPTTDMMVFKNTTGQFVWQAVADDDDSNFMSRRMNNGDTYNWYLDSQPILWDFDPGTTWTPGITLAIKDAEGNWQTEGTDPTLRIAKSDGTQYSTLDYGTLTFGSGVKITSGSIDDLPETCNQGDLYIVTDAGSGNYHLYICSDGEDTWSGILSEDIAL